MALVVSSATGVLSQLRPSAAGEPRGPWLVGGEMTGVVGEPRRPSRKLRVLRLLSLVVDSGA